jgi:hypothetical protein
MNRTPAGVSAAGEKLDHLAGGWHTSGVCGISVVVPAVSLVPRSTTGYKLESLRDKEFRCFRHEPCGRVGFQGIELARKFDRN